MKQILTLILTLPSLMSVAQHQCGTDMMHRHRMTTDSAYRTSYIQNQDLVRNKVAAMQQGAATSLSAGSAYQIPVVVHIIHLGEPVGVGSNISDSQVVDAIDGLNARFAGTMGMGPDIEMQFCLAQTDPTGCPTTGIVRADGSSVALYASEGIFSSEGCGADEDAIKSLSRWPVDEYYNIWVVHDICGEIAGYAYYPYGGPNDGTVMDSEYMSSETHVLTHEVGHGLNLAHTFDGDDDGNTCPQDFNCAVDGDQVCDTPPHKVDDCDSNPCTSSGNFLNSSYNFMSYCWFEQQLQRFTPGQKTRMQATMNTPPRAPLVTSFGCAQNGVSLSAVQQQLCVGESTVISASGPQSASYIWSTGESGASITVSPTVSTTYTVTATTAGGCDLSVPIEITVYPVTAPQIVVTGETQGCSGDLVLSVSPTNAFQSYEWSTGATTSSIGVTSSGEYWVQVTDMNGCVNASLMDDPTVVVIGAETPIIEQTETMLSVTNGSYASYQWFLNGVAIPGATGPTHIPTAGGYYLLQVTNGEGCFATSTNILFSMVGISDEQAEAPFTIHPNPNDGTFIVELKAVTGPVRFELFNSMGQKVSSTELHVDQTHRAQEFSGISSGTYILNVTTADGHFVKQVVVR